MKNPEETIKLDFSVYSLIRCLCRLNPAVVAARWIPQ